MPKRILAIESATDWLSIALFEDGERASLLEAEESRQHASSLLPLVERGLVDLGWTPSSLDGLIVSAGPGSFTSLRIGLATAKGLAFGRELEAVGVSTLEAMAWGALSGFAEEGGEPEEQVVALLDARRGEWYAGGFRRGANGLCAGIPEGLYDPLTLTADLAEAVILVCPEAKGFEAAFEQAGVRIAGIVAAEPARPRADHVGEIGLLAFERGEAAPAEALVARYLRRAEAEAKRLGGPVESGELARVVDPSR